MTTSELIKKLQELDPSGNRPVVTYAGGSISHEVVEKYMSIITLYKDPSYTDPCIFNDSKERTYTIPVEVISI